VPKDCEPLTTIISPDVSPARANNDSPGRSPRSRRDPPSEVDHPCHAVEHGIISHNRPYYPERYEDSPNRIDRSDKSLQTDREYYPERYEGSSPKMRKRQEYNTTSPRKIQDYYEREDRRTVDSERFESPRRYNREDDERFESPRRYNREDERFESPRRLNREDERFESPRRSNRDSGRIEDPRERRGRRHVHGGSQSSSFPPWATNDDLPRNTRRDYAIEANPDMKIAQQTKGNERKRKRL